MVTSLAEVFGAELDLADMFLSVKVFADIHNSVQVMTFTEDINGILMLTSLDIEISGFFPVVAISFEFCLFDQNCRVQEWTFTLSVLSVFSDKVISFRELFELGEQSDCFIEHLGLYVVLSSFLKLALERHHL